jgi:alpha-beta hydrolase superfamily lysophospholipase
MRDRHSRPGYVTHFRRIACLGLVAAAAATATAQSPSVVTIRGHDQKLLVYGQRGGVPIIVSSGDGGWIHLGPHVAETLAASGYFVVGFDVRAYLSSFTSGGATLKINDEPGDYRTLVEFAARGGSAKPILVGVSEGAGLSVLAATDPATRAAIAGVVALGLPEINELGWRWRDAIIYVTHGVPNEPTFSTSGLVMRMAPSPLAAIHSTQDEFAPLAEVQRIIAAAGEPKRLWVIQASDHRFSNNLPEFDRRLLEALDWVRQNAARQ